MGATGSHGRAERRKLLLPFPPLSDEPGETIVRLELRNADEKLAVPVVVVTDGG